MSRYHFKSLKLDQNSAMNESWTPDKQKVSEYKQEIPQSLLLINPRHREEEQQNIYSHKTSGRQLKQSNYHSVPRQDVNKNRKNTKRCITKQIPTQNPKHILGYIEQRINNNVRFCMILELYPLFSSPEPLAHVELL